ncbi:hypothetical protein BC827DRAFT_1157940 [Russula dissimulans]|nr:hypothetical protein BC827DRAFT_1157940 [Russula dissimulans]
MEKITGITIIPSSFPAPQPVGRKSLALRPHCANAQGRSETRMESTLRQPLRAGRPEPSSCALISHRLYAPLMRRVLWARLDSALWYPPLDVSTFMRNEDKTSAMPCEAKNVIAPPGTIRNFRGLDLGPRTVSLYWDCALSVAHSDREAVFLRSTDGNVTATAAAVEKKGAVALWLNNATEADGRFLWKKPHDTNNRGREHFHVHVDQKWKDQIFCNALLDAHETVVSGACRVHHFISSPPNDLFSTISEKGKGVPTRNSSSRNVLDGESQGYRTPHTSWSWAHKSDSKAPFRKATQKSRRVCMCYSRENFDMEPEERKRSLAPPSLVFSRG